MRKRKYTPVERDKRRKRDCRTCHKPLERSYTKAELLNALGNAYDALNGGHTTIALAVIGPAWGIEGLRMCNECRRRAEPAASSSGCDCPKPGPHKAPTALVEACECWNAQGKPAWESFCPCDCHTTKHPASGTDDLDLRGSAAALTRVVFDDLDAFLNGLGSTDPSGPMCTCGHVKSWHHGPYGCNYKPSPGNYCACTAYEARA